MLLRLSFYSEMVIHKVYVWFCGQRVDLCHQENEEELDDEEDNVENRTQQALLEGIMREQHGSGLTKSHRRCCSIQGIHIGSRQKYVIMVKGMDQRIFSLLRISLITKLSISIRFDAFLPPDYGSNLCCDDGVCHTDLRWK
jgi:hypothetical protein